ncbi:hypothetical protein Tco_1372913 [Tanacetum coccineum]
MMVQAQEEMGEGSANPIDPHHTPTIIQPSTYQPQKKQKPRKSKRKDTEVPQPSSPTYNVTDKAIYEEMDDSLERAATTATSLDVEQDRGYINKTQSKATLNEQGRIVDIDADAGINLVSTHFDVDTDIFGVHDLVGDEVVVETEVASKDVNLSVDEVNLAQALAALKSAKPKADKVMLQEPEHGTIITTTTATTDNIKLKAKGLVIHEEEQATTPTVSSQQLSQVKVQDKGKGIMVEELEKPIKKKELIRLDEEIASKLQNEEEEEEEERLAREKAQQIKEANIVSWDNVQAMIDADYQMAHKCNKKQES